MEIIEKALSEHKNPAIAFSGGKDSTVVLNLVREIDPNIKAVFCNTGVEHKTTYQYIKRVKNVIWLKPKKSFWDCIEEYGFPKMKGETSGIRQNQCCNWLKDKPMKEYIKENNIDLIFTGLTMAESHQRMMFLKSWGNYGYVKSWKVFKCHPIHDWDEKKVWNYIKNNNLDYNKGYDKDMIRSGCQPCTAYCSWKERLAKENFNLYAKVQHMRLQSLIEDY